MQVIFEKAIHFKDKDKWHIVQYKSWEKGGVYALIMMRLQYFCQDQGHAYDMKHTKFIIQEYNRVMHHDNLCEKCLKASLKSKRTTSLTDTPMKFGPRSV